MRRLLRGALRLVKAVIQAFSSVSLRVKFTLTFVLLVVFSAAVSTIIGSQIVTTAMLNQTVERVHTGLEAARMIYLGELDRVRQSLILAASAHRIRNALLQAETGRLPELIAGLQREHGLDFLAFVDSQHRVVRPAGASQKSSGDDLAGLLAPAWAGQAVVSTELFSREALAAEDPALASRARIPITYVPRTMQQPNKREVDAGLVQIAAAPVKINGVIRGVMYGGVLLNRTTELVDRIRQSIFGGETFKGEEVGTVSIFLDDVRISTNVYLSRGERAIGTRASAVVAEAVLERGESWHGRAFVVHDWYATAYEPLRDHSGRIVGMFYVGMREAAYLAIRTDMMMTFLVVVIIGVAIVLGLTYVITRGMTQPLEEMVSASKRIAAGDLDHRVHVRSHDEIGLLAASFNAMLRSLATTREQLEDSKHHLEERVQQRTNDLINIQVQMAQSQKLASLGRMASGVAHEINNPLGGILTFAMLALEDCGPDHPLRSNLDIIVKQTLRCRDIVKGLLDFSRQSESVATPTDVHAVIDSTLSLLESQAIFYNIHTVRELEHELPPILIDPSRLQQVLMNLILNAVDAMEGNGVLTLQTATDPASEEVLIRISDTGKGISAEHQSLIFEPFFTTKEVGKGTGLGLAIVHGIVTKAGGSVSAQSSREGTTFTIRFPRAEAGGGSHAPEAAEASVGPRSR